MQAKLIRYFILISGDDSDVNSSAPLNVAILLLLASVILSICQTFKYNFGLYT